MFLSILAPLLFLFPPSLLFSVLTVSEHTVPAVAGSGLETAIPTHHQDCGDPP